MVGGTDHVACTVQLGTSLDTFKELGLPVAVNKLDGQMSCLMFSTGRSSNGATAATST